MLFHQFLAVMMILITRTGADQHEQTGLKIFRGEK
jgi:hypothetical protein